MEYGRAYTKGMRLRPASVPMSVRTLLVVVLSTAVLGAGTLYVAESEAGLPGRIAAVIASTVAGLTNDARVRAGYPILAVDPVLSAVAQAKADDMATHGYFAHTSPGGRTPWYWFLQEGYVFRYAGENLAVDYDDSAEVVRAWMLSASHRANIVGTQFTDVGVAVATGTLDGRPATFVVQVFGTRKETQGSRVIEIGTPSKSATGSMVLASTERASADAVLGARAGAYLAETSVPWWFQMLALVGLK